MQICIHHLLQTQTKTDGSAVLVADSQNVPLLHHVNPPDLCQTPGGISRRLHEAPPLHRWRDIAPFGQAAGDLAGSARLPRLPLFEQIRYFMLERLFGYPEIL